MYVGLQIEAPRGWGSFQKGTRYYFAGDRSELVDGVNVTTVLIVWFARSDKRWQSWRVHTMVLLRHEFEESLTADPPRLRKCAHQFNLPPWLEEVDSVNFDEIEERRNAAFAKRQKTCGQVLRSYRQQVEARLTKIAPAMEFANEILQASDPLGEIYQTIKGDTSCQPNRVQLWFFAYTLHGQNEWSLKMPTHNIGRWRRDADEHKHKKFGRPSLHGSCFGWASFEMRKQIVACYIRYSDLGVTMRRIHRTALRDDFGCITVKDENGNDRWIHPQNKPFPSCGQFRYVVVDELTLEYVQTQIYGHARMKSKATFNVGNQTAQYGSILEELQVDAYFLAERPKSVTSDAPSEALVVAEGVCVTTGAVVGVGFSLGGETGEAYRSLLFCMAVPEEYRARLYGIPPEMLNWKMQGVPAAFTSDRGPAGHRKFAETLEQNFPVKKIAPSYDGQAKAPVETTHPKKTKLEGEPSYVASSLNVIEMAKREVFRAASKNHSKDISPRLSDQAIRDFRKEGRLATPHHYWQYLNERMRTCARELTIEEAVRAFWTPTKLPVDADGVRFRHRHYTSDALRKSSLMKQVGLTKDLEIKAYSLSLVMRIVWVEVNGRLIEVEAARKCRVGDEELMVPLSELDATADLLAELRSRTRVSAEAAQNRAEVDFENTTGKSWDAGTRKKGSAPKPSGSAAHEAKITKGQKPRKAA